jgi:hypothetical protein
MRRIFSSFFGWLVYFDARTKIHLQNYLDCRADENPALFVSLTLPH